MLKYNFNWDESSIVNAACAGDVEAQEEMVSQYLYDGEFFDDSPDWDKALFWLNKAAQNNSMFLPIKPPPPFIEWHFMKIYSKQGPWK